MQRNEIAGYLESAFTGVPDDFSVDYIRGKVRDIFDLGPRLLICTTDRISAFDVVLSTIPCKGEVLNGLSNYWFNKTTDIVGNHIDDEASARSVTVKKCDVLPVEVVVRGYLTGSAWRDYEKGKPVSGIELKKGLRFNHRFDEPLLTPSTKAEQGDHDEPIASSEIVKRGIVEKALWEKVEETALALFKRGSEVAADRGLILVDTKYEFGVLNGELTLVDEIHTPDSSRFWFADTYDELFSAGEKQREIDKEYLRGWLMENGYQGEGTPPVIPDEIRIEVAWRYIQAYELITGKSFNPSGSTAEAETELIRSYLP
jgi:phosphoribosylaminoimidazole-succinocarboxamide synthase